MFYNLSLDFKENLKKNYMCKKMENGAKKQEFFNCLLFPFFHILSHFFQARFQNAFFFVFPHLPGEGC